jgi:hypothetical protein
VREVLSLLKKDYNNKVRRGLNNGSISPSRFLDDFYSKPELFESPKVTSIRRKSKEAEDMERLDLNFPNFDASIGCTNCKGYGAYYKILALDEQNFSRQVKCKGCQHEWRLDE